MDPVTSVFLFGSLSRFHRGKQHEALKVNLQVSTRIPELLDLLKIPAKDVSLAMVNHRSVPKDYVVQPGDRLSLFPTEYPIFADWRDHRF
jgi:molybdopterin converting factor small subunit